MKTTTTAPTTIRDLATLGFNRAEIQRLVTLKASYDPYREYCQSHHEYEQLCFLKWRYQQGDVTETIAD